MRKNNNIQSITVAGLLCAIAIAIPMFMPLKIVIEPASFTLASHVPVFIAMFISFPVAVAVAIGSAIGFFLAGFPIVVVARAASHIVFAALGAWYLQKNACTLQTKKGKFFFGLFTSIIHGLFELLVVIPFYFSSSMGTAYYQQGFLYSVAVLVGLGTVVHSMVDFYLAIAVMQPLSKQVGMAERFVPVK